MPQCPPPPSPNSENNAFVRTTVGVGTVKFGGFLLFVLVVCKNQVFPVIRGPGWYLRDADFCPATCCPFLQFFDAPPGARLSWPP